MHTCLHTTPVTVSNLSAIKFTKTRFYFDLKIIELDHSTVDTYRTLIGGLSVSIIVDQLKEGDTSTANVCDTILQSFTDTITLGAIASRPNIAVTR